MEAWFIIVLTMFSAALCGGILGGAIVSIYLINDFAKFLKYKVEGQ